MKIFLLFVCLFAGGICQNDVVDQNIRELFATPSTDFLSELGEVVTQKPLESLGAIEKCGAGSNEGKNICVPYYNCDGKTRTIIQTGATDGFGVIDIRIGANSCDHHLDVCCKIPPTGIPPSVTTQSPVVDPLPSTIPPVTRGDFCGIRNPNGLDFKITGNKDNEAEIFEFPWMVAILKKNHNPDIDKVLAICGGSLITPIAVLSGAHCVAGLKASDIKIRAGEWDTQTTRERIPHQERDVADIIIHKDFQAQSVYNNVAILILNEPLVRADNLGTVCLPPQGLKFNSKDCFVTGWGKDKFEKEGQYQVILKKIQLPIVQNDQCQSSLRSTRLGQFFTLHDSFICAGGELGKDACTGDGGSPLVCPDPSNPGRYLQAGIVSWGIGCGEKNVPGVYTDVSKFREWVDNEMNKQNLDTAPYTPK